MVSLYCVKCKAKKDVAESDLTKVMVGSKTQRPALKGKCPTCGTTVFKFVKA